MTYAQRTVNDEGIFPTKFGTFLFFEKVSLYQILVFFFNGIFNRVFLSFCFSSRISGDVRNGFEEDPAFAVPRRGAPVSSALSRVAPPWIAQSLARPLCPSDII
jgi:hypothetical protein